MKHHSSASFRKNYELSVDVQCRVTCKSGRLKLSSILSKNIKRCFTTDLPKSVA